MLKLLIVEAVESVDCYWCLNRLLLKLFNVNDVEFVVESVVEAFDC